jgi:hypothetical protein
VRDLELLTVNVAVPSVELFEFQGEVRTVD